jgi:mersacidin/lichenicidin family type 2 lantibiotic
MSNIVRAWKDASYRQSLSVGEQTALPANPAGEIELNDIELDAIFGADGSGTNREETTGVASSSATLQQNGGLNVGIPNIAAFVPVLAIPVGTQFNPAQCISSGSANPHFCMICIKFWFYHLYILCKF